MRRLPHLGGEHVLLIALCGVKESLVQALDRRRLEVLDDLAGDIAAAETD
jgi:hypothetical protein